MSSFDRPLQEIAYQVKRCQPSPEKIYIGRFLASYDAFNRQSAFCHHSVVINEILDLVTKA